MVLSDRTIARLIGDGRIAIDPYDESLLQPSSLDVRVDRYFRVFRNSRYPYIDVKENDVELGHEATVSKIGEEQLFYLMSRGLSEAEASAMIVSGFVEPITKELPLEYAVEMNRLIQLQMEGSVG